MILRRCSGRPGNRASCGARDQPLRLLRGDDHGVVYGGERRGVAQVKRGEVGDGEPGVQGGRQHVDAFRGALKPGHLAAEQPTAGRVHQPHVHWRAARVVLRPRPGDYVRGVRGQAGGPGLGEPQPRTGHLEAEYLDHSGADDARERHGATGRNGAGHPAGLVGGRPERHPGWAAEHQVWQGDGVAGREDPGQRRAHPRVDHDGPIGQVPGTSADQHLRGRAHPGRDDHQVGVELSAVHHRCQAAIAAAHGVQPGTEPQPDMPSQLRLGKIGDRLVDAAKDARQRLDDLHLDARADQCLRRLQPDVPSPHHDSAADHGSVQQAAQLDRLVERPDREDALMIEPGHRRAHRIGATGDDKRVVAERLACAFVANVHLLRVRVYPADPGAQAQVDAALLAELGRRIGEQALRALDGAAEEIGDPAHAVGGETAGLTDNHVQVGRGAPGSRCGRHPRGATADHYDPCHVPSSPSSPAQERACGRCLPAGQVFQRQRTAAGSPRQISGIRRRTSHARSHE